MHKKKTIQYVFKNTALRYFLTRGRVVVQLILYDNTEVKRKIIVEDSKWVVLDAK